jgi:hypothetical protein
LKKSISDLGYLWHFQECFGRISKMVLVSQKASLSRNCGGAKFAYFEKMLLGKELLIFIHSADFVEI